MSRAKSEDIEQRFIAITRAVLNAKPIQKKRHTAQAALSGAEMKEGQAKAGLAGHGGK